MSKFTMSILVLVSGAVLFGTPVYASGSGSHSHDHQEVKAGQDNNAIIYKDSQGGIDAYIEFFDFDGNIGTEVTTFFVKCKVQAFLKDAETGQHLNPSRLALRATIGHDQFGAAMVMLPVGENRMQTDLFVKKRGEHHYLLIAEIDGAGVREFHFHHTFD
jgi:hypothetical protein